MPPLPEEFRPQTLEEVVGQEHLLNEKGFLRFAIKEKKGFSCLLWGPPGCGKTTLARLYARSFSQHLFSFSAVTTSIAELKKIIEEIESCPLLYSKPVLFLDEIHRFNKAQQDLFLPYVEKGTFILIAATTENPSFYINKALLSRLRVLELHALNLTSLAQLLAQYETKRGTLPLTENAKTILLQSAQGDGRALLNLIETIREVSPTSPIDAPELALLIQKRAALFDRDGDAHYNLISALHKSIRGSDPDAALYWFARMLEGGEDPLYIARRLIRLACEDVGLADPEALKIALAARDAYEMLGSPEGELALAELVIYLALAPKSNACYTAFQKAQECAKNSSHLPPPKTILNAPTSLMKELGYGKGYQYDHDHPLAFSGQDYFPEGMARLSFYQPVERGMEREMKKRLDYFANLRKKA